MIKFLKLSIVSLTLFLIAFSPSYAVEATGSAVSDDDVKEKIKERLEKVVETGLDKVKGIIDQENKDKLFAWVGTIKSLNKTNLSIETINGIKEAEIATNAAIFKVATGKARKEIKSSDLQVGQYIINIGPKNENDVITGKRLLVMDEVPTVAKRDLVAGKVTEIDEEKVTVKKNGEALTLTIDKKVNLKINAIKKPVVDDIQIDDYLTAIVILDEKGEIKTVKTVLVIPGKTNPQAQENEVAPEKLETNEDTNEATKSSE